MQRIGSAISVTRIDGANEFLDFTIPAGVAVGDAMVVLIATTTATLPAGWTSEATIASGGRLAAAYSKIVDAADLAAAIVSVAVSGVPYGGVLVVYRDGVFPLASTGATEIGLAIWAAELGHVAPQTEGIMPSDRRLIVWAIDDLGAVVTTPSLAALTILGTFADPESNTLTVAAEFLAGSTGLQGSIELETALAANSLAAGFCLRAQDLSVPTTLADPLPGHIGLVP